MIYYNGPGSNKDFKHTQKEFLKIMHREFPDMILLRIKGLPPDPTKIKKSDLARWMQFAKAHTI